MSEARYAIYYAPKESTLLWQMASRWIGRDASIGAEVAPVEMPHFSPEQVRAITKFPRHYGFHATLKPPFRLREGFKFEDLMVETEQLAIRHQSCRLPRPQLSLLGSFIAITLCEPSAEISALADAAVRDLDQFRRSPSQDELEKRRKGLSSRQSELLVEWGYPYVFDEWQFHMTLASGLIDSEHAHVLLEDLMTLFEPALIEDLLLESICVYSQRSDTESFNLVGRFPLKG